MRDTAGRFTRGAAPGPGRPKGSRPEAFRRWISDALESEENRTLLLARIKRELKGDGPATLTLKALAYAYGEPRQVIELEARAHAARLARAAGVALDDLLEEARKLEELADPEDDAA